MFRRPFRTRSSTKVRSSDRRKLRDDVRAGFAGIDDETIDMLVPSGKRTDIMVNQVTTAKGDRITVYVIDGQPAFFTDSVGRLYPTVYTLWRLPDPALWGCWRTWGPVFEKIAQGADLMLPGVIVPEEGLGTFEEGEIRCLQVRGRGGAPLAVGRAALDSERAKGLRGKGLVVVHCCGDQLWESGSKESPPVIPELNISLNEDEAPGGIEASAIADHAQDEGTGDNDNDTNASEAATGAGKGEVDVAEADRAYMAIFLAVLAGLTDAELPLSASTLMSKYMGAAGPDIRHTSHKKVARFLKAAHKCGYVDVKESSGGLAIVAVEWAHPDMRDTGVPKAAPKKGGHEAGGASAPDSNSISFDVVEMYQPHKAQWEVLGRDPGTKELFRAGAVRACLKQYIEAHALAPPCNKRVITLDTHMAAALKTGDKTCPRDKLVGRFIELMKPYHLITRLRGGEPVVGVAKPKKGPVAKIMVSPLTRTGTKKATRVRNLHKWSISNSDFASAVQKRTASGASVSAVGDVPNEMQVIVQGNRGAEVVEQLVSVYNVPLKFIDNQCNASKR